MYWVRKRDVYFTCPYLMFDRYRTEYNLFEGYICFLNLYLPSYMYIKFEFSILRSKTSSPKDFEFKRFDCIIISQGLIVGVPGAVKWRVPFQTGMDQNIGTILNGKLHYFFLVRTKVFPI